MVVSCMHIGKHSASSPKTFRYSRRRRHHHLGVSYTSNGHHIYSIIICWISTLLNDATRACLCLPSTVCVHEEPPTHTQSRFILRWSPPAPPRLSCAGRTQSQTHRQTKDKDLTKDRAPLWYCFSSRQADSSNSSLCYENSN